METVASANETKSANLEFAEKSLSSKLEGLDTLLRDRLIGRTPAFGAGYPGSSPGPGANLSRNLGCFRAD